MRDAAYGRPVQRSDENEFGGSHRRQRGGASGSVRINGAAETDKAKDEKAEFQKKLTQTALMLAANSAMDAQDAASDLDDDDE